MNKHESRRKILEAEELDEESDVDMKEDDDDEDSVHKGKDSDDMSDDELQDRMLEENKQKTKKTIDLERMTNRQRMAYQAQ